MYAASVYAVRYLNDIEKIQSLFFKRLLNLPFNTPDYALRLEVGVSHIGTLVFKQVLNWLIKILSIPENRFPIICFLRQKNLANSEVNLTKYNWVKQIKEIFSNL